MKSSDAGLVRKCAFCGESIDINLNSLGEVIYYDKKTYHSKCFIQEAIAASKSKNSIRAEKYTTALRGIGDIKIQTLKHLKNELYKKKVADFIKESYDITILPKSIYTRLSDIYTGKYKDLSEGIPPQYLYDMWKRSLNFLNGTANRNKAKGNNMTAMQRVIYDIAILTNKYDSYKKWLEKQKILAAEKVKSDIYSDTDKVIKYFSKAQSKNNAAQYENNDISSLTDEIFGN